MSEVKKTPAVLILLAWLFVGIPAGWGIWQTWKNARKLFQSPPPAASAPVNAAPVTAPSPGK